MVLACQKFCLNQSYVLILKLKWEIIWLVSGWLKLFWYSISSKKRKLSFFCKIYNYFENFLRKIYPENKVIYKFAKNTLYRILIYDSFQYTLPDAFRETFACTRALHFIRPLALERVLRFFRQNPYRSNLLLFSLSNRPGIGHLSRSILYIFFSIHKHSSTVEWRVQNRTFWEKCILI